MSKSACNGPRSATARRGRGWIWFFVVLACLVALALGVQRWWYAQQRLTPQQLEEARALWKAHRPADYDLEYTKKGDATGTFLVQVRGGKVISATLDGRPLEPRLYASCDMDGLFDDIEGFLEIDSRPGSPAVFATATFDREQDGHLVHYVRSVMRPGSRVQIDVQLRRLSASSDAKVGGLRTPLASFVRRAPQLEQAEQVFAETTLDLATKDSVGTGTV